MEKKKLDSFSKIIVATSAINYMANQLSAVNEQVKMIAATHKGGGDMGVFEDSINAKDEALAEAVKKLGEIMEELGNCINNCDATCRIDERVTKEAFNIIVHGKDNIE